MSDTLEKFFRDLRDPPGPVYLKDGKDPDFPNIPLPFEIGSHITDVVSQDRSSTWVGEFVEVVGYFQPAGVFDGEEKERGEEVVGYFIHDGRLQLIGKLHDPLCPDHKFRYDDLNGGNLSALSEEEVALRKLRM